MPAVHGLPKVRARLAVKLGDYPWRHRDAFFSSMAVLRQTNAIRIARMFTGRHKIAALSLIPWRYGRQSHADRRSRRWAAEPGIPELFEFPISTTAFQQGAGTRLKKCWRVLKRSCNWKVRRLSRQLL